MINKNWVIRTSSILSIEKYPVEYDADLKYDPTECIELTLQDDDKGTIVHKFYKYEKYKYEEFKNLSKFMKLAKVESDSD